MPKITPIRPPDKLKDELQRHAKTMGMTLNGLILQILWDWLKRNES